MLRSCVPIDSSFLALGIFSPFRMEDVFFFFFLLLRSLISGFCFGTVEVGWEVRGSMDGRVQLGLFGFDIC